MRKPPQFIIVLALAAACACVLYPPFRTAYEVHGNVLRREVAYHWIWQSAADWQTDYHVVLSEKIDLSRLVGELFLVGLLTGLAGAIASLRQRKILRVPITRERATTIIEVPDGR